MNLANPRQTLPQATPAAGHPSDSPPSILALDLGTTTGWAVRTGRCRILHGTAEFRPTRFEGGGMRYLRFGRWLDQTLEITGGIDAVYFEEVRRHIGTDSAHVYGGFLAALTSWCEQKGIAYQGVPVGTWKRNVCGKGNAGKADVIAAMRERGFEPADDNEADALAILLWALSTNGGIDG
jgi:Holliday junction resolvasome RuvABC endonuclease subunit